MNEEIEKHRISIDIFDLDNYIEKLAAKNKMNTLDFKSLLRQEQNYETFKENITKQLIHQRLINTIAGGKLRIASKEDLQIYYQNNKEAFNKLNKFFEKKSYSVKVKKKLSFIGKKILQKTYQEIGLN